LRRLCCDQHVADLSRFAADRASCLSITPEDILRALGKDDDEVGRIAEETEERRRMNAFLRNVVSA
jgi:hypothetical protein